MDDSYWRELHRTSPARKRKPLSRVAANVHKVDGNLQVPAPAGTRVTFTASMTALLSTDFPPKPDERGTVVSVKTSSGLTTEHGGRVFVQWESGRIQALDPQFLRRASVKMANLDLTEFLKTASGNLIQKSTRDLWSMSRDADGNLTVDRLFDDDGSPLKG